MADIVAKNAVDGYITMETRSRWIANDTRECYSTTGGMMNNIKYIPELNN